MEITEIAEWLAPAATMTAAMMTASNLGARVTGWGFAIFTLGSICWIMVGLQSDQTALIITNGFLTLVNAIGIWRWLGRQARYEAVGEAAEATNAVLPATGIVGRKVIDRAGQAAGEAVEALVDSGTATIRQIIVRTGGIGGVGERLVALEISDVELSDKTIGTSLSAAQIAKLPSAEMD
jgi:hypothetical protein